MSSESVIEDRIIRDTAALGYPKADVIRRCRVGRYIGIVDLLLLPRTGDRRLVLIEVKGGHNAEAHAKVIGQLLLYFTGALQIGTEGLELMRQFARSERETALRESPSSLRMLSGGVKGPDQAWATLRKGDPISPDQIHLFIGLDKEPTAQLADTLAVVHSGGLRIDVVVASPRRRVHVWTPQGPTPRTAMRLGTAAFAGH